MKIELVLLAALAGLALYEHHKASVAGSDAAAVHQQNAILQDAYTRQILEMPAGW